MFAIVGTVVVVVVLRIPPTATGSIALDVADDQFLVPLGRHGVPYYYFFVVVVCVRRRGRRGVEGVEGALADGMAVAT